jgi:Holliday junction resolvase RusA-like endonuclease
MTAFSILIDGEPRGKGRPRCECSRGKPHLYTDAQTAAYEERIAWTFKETYPGHEPLEGRVSVLIMMVSDRTATDLDNVVKIALDALNGVAWKDDSQVIHIEAHRSKPFGDGTYLAIQFKTV